MGQTAHCTLRTPQHPASRFSLFVLAVVLFLPTIILHPSGLERKQPGGIADAKPTPKPHGKVGFSSWWTRKDARDDHNKRQTIDEQMVEADQYSWGGKGDGSDVCKRFSHQSALVGDTVYIYGGQAQTSADQKDHMWNSNFLSISLADTFQISSPPIKAISGKDAGTPPVANAYLFSSLTGNGDGELYLYGGLFPDKPFVRPSENSVWKYSIKDNSWSEIKQAGFKISDDTEQKYIDRAAEGAGISIPERGLGFYFGGHLDGYTTRGWEQSIPRVYLKSLLELRFPGGTNGDVGEGQVGFRNVSEGSGLDKVGVPERADGVLLFVPWGKEGLLVGIGGGRNDTFSQLNIVDIYDLSTSTWSRQATSGPTPKYRVNPCAVVASAPDGSSHNIYFYGGQNLVPYGDQVQYDDMWILSIPAFTWIQLNMTDSVPPGRAGHSCAIWGRQMVVIGGYVSKDLSCDSPGIYVFDATELQWKREFVGVGGGSGGETTNTNNDNTDNNNNNNNNNNKNDDKNTNNGGHGGNTNNGNVIIYQVPVIVQQIVGGDENGGATITKPIVTPGDGSPLQTGGDVTYTYSHAGPEFTYTRTITNSDGSVVTETGTSGGSESSRPQTGPNIGLIIGAIVGGLVGLVIIIFAGLFILYKRKIKRIRGQRLGEMDERKGAGGVVWGAGGRRRESGTTESTASERRSTDELMDGAEPSFWGVLLSPRRSLRVVNS